MNRMLVDLQEFVREIARLYGDRKAYQYFVEDSVVSKTYRELEQDVNAVASWLVQRGCQEKHIGILGGSSYSWIVSFLGIINSGNIVIPIDRMLPETELLQLLEMGDIDVLFLSEEFEPLMRRIREEHPRVTDIVSFSGTTWREILRTSQRSLPEMDPNALAEILFTSGTTGTSKGVMLSQKNIVSNINDIYRMDFTQNLKCTPVVLSILPIHHTFELTVDNLGVLYCGATVCINDKLENIVANMNRFHPAVVLVVPAIAEIFYKKIKEGIESGSNKGKMAVARSWNRMLGKMKIDARRTVYKKILDKFGGNLTNVVVGGAALRPEIVHTFEEFGIHMYQGYGLTECAPLVAANYPGKNRAGSVGQPVSYMDVKIENQEIAVRGSGVMLGYYKNPQATAEVIRDGWFYTGDLGYQDEDGYLYITGRSKNLIVLENGKNVYPEELEEHIIVVPGVKDVMVYDDKGKISALVVPTVPGDVTLQKSIKQGIRKVNEKLPTYKRIVGLDFRAQDFPKTTTMKIKRREVMEWIKERREKKATDYVPPVTAEQKRLVMAFEQALGRRNIGIRDDFFELGGDSLTALELATVIGVQAQDIYDNPTVEQLEQAMLMCEQAATEEEWIDVNALIRNDSNLIYDVTPKYVLLTGATGFLGAHILRELLRRQINVVCLVRNEERLRQTLKNYFPKEYEYFSYKVVKGDIEAVHFGLPDEKYEKLKDRVNMVIHTAANVHHTGHYADFERTNVIGTQNVIDFCKDAGAVLQYTSTASVNGAGTVAQSNPNARFDEFSLDIGQNYMQNVYIHSKFKAEERVLLARAEGLKANIFRIGNLTWRMKDGKFQRNAQDNGFLHRCRGLFKLGMYSKELAAYPIDFTAVDECADAYVRLALHNRVNNIYNLYNPNVFYLESLCNKLLLRVKRVPQEVFEKNLKERIADREIAVLSFYNAIATSSQNVPMSNEFTVQELKKLGFKWSKINLRYLSYIKSL